VDLFSEEEKKISEEKLVLTLSLEFQFSELLMYWRVFHSSLLQCSILWSNRNRAKYNKTKCIFFARE